MEGVATGKSIPRSRDGRGRRRRPLTTEAQRHGAAMGKRVESTQQSCGGRASSRTLFSWRGLSLSSRGRAAAYAVQASSFSGVNGRSLPSEVRFNHVPFFLRRGESGSFWAGNQGWLYRRTRRERRGSDHEWTRINTNLFLTTKGTRGTKERVRQRSNE